MRKFKLRNNVARRLMGLDVSSRREPAAQATSETAEIPAGEKREGVPKQGFRIAWRTDVGKIRKNNQDAVILGRGLVGIADGMGGHLGGETASASLRDGLIRETGDSVAEEERLRETVKKLNLELWEQQENDASLTGMGTTLTVLWAAPEEMIVAQVGDSRAYLLRDGEFRQMTSDHSMVADMVRRGVLTEEQAASHPLRNYITRAVGTDTTIDVDTQRVPRHAGDRWLVCSDGLHGAVRKAELARMCAVDSLEDAANQLLEAALNNGGKDNISLVLLQDDGPSNSDQPDDSASAGEEADA